MTIKIKGLGKITASKKTLNDIANAFSNSSEYHRTKHHEVSAYKDEKISEEIYYFLEVL